MQAFLVLYKAPLSGHTAPSLLFLLSNWWYIGRARVSKRDFFLLVSSTMERFLGDPQHKQMLFEIHLYFFSPSLSVFFFWNSLQDMKEEKQAESNTTEQNCCLSLIVALNSCESFVYSAGPSLCVTTVLSLCVGITLRASQSVAFRAVLRCFHAWQTTQCRVIPSGEVMSSTNSSLKWLNNAIVKNPACCSVGLRVCGGHGRGHREDEPGYPVAYGGFLSACACHLVRSLLAAKANLCGQRGGIDKTWSLLSSLPVAPTPHSLTRS